MSVQIENLEKSMAKLTVEVPAEDFEKAVQNVYMRQKKNIAVPGFRKGKVPRAIIEKMYGTGVFFEDAANELLPTAYENAAKESGLEITSRPEIEVTQIEKGKPFIFTATVAVRPEVVLGEYKGLEVPPADRNVTDEEVEAELKREQEKNSRQVTVEDRGAEMGDTVTIDYEGRVDGELFDGGSAQNFDLKLGSHSFIPGFEEGLVGVNAGETRDVNVTFPEEYHAENLKGKPAVFTCTVHKVSATELPELDDDFAQDVSEFDTMEEYRADVRGKLEERKAEQARQQIREAALAKAAANAGIEIPDAMIETQAENMVENYARRIQAQGMSFDQYLQMFGSTAETMKDQMKPQAEVQIRSELVLDKIAEAEGIEISDEEVDAEIAEMAKSYGMEADRMKELVGEEEKKNIRRDLASRKAMDLIADAAVETEAAVEKESTEE